MELYIDDCHKIGILVFRKMFKKKTKTKKMLYNFAGSQHHPD